MGCSKVYIVLSINHDESSELLEAFLSYEEALFNAKSRIKEESEFGEEHYEIVVNVDSPVITVSAYRFGYEYLICEFMIWPVPLNASPLKILGAQAI